MTTSAPPRFGEERDSVCTPGDHISTALYHFSYFLLFGAHDFMVARLLRQPTLRPRPTLELSFLIHLRASIGTPRVHIVSSSPRRSGFLLATDLYAAPIRLPLFLAVSGIPALFSCAALIEAALLLLIGHHPRNSRLVRFQELACGLRKIEALAGELTPI